MRKAGHVRVWKHPVGVWAWDCRFQQCNAPNDEFREGASLFWEICQQQADEHAREWHKRERHISRDAPTPPGGAHYEFTDTGHIHVIGM